MNLAKRLFCAFLAVLLLGSLGAMALEDAPADDVIEVAEEIVEAPEAEDVEAPAEEPVEAPAEEPAEEPIEVPAEAPVEEPVIDEPAADGVNVYGTYYTSGMDDNVSLTLKGDLTLVVDADRTFKSISGDYALTIIVQSGKRLTVHNTSGHGISVSSLTVNGAGTLGVAGSKDALNVDKDVNISVGRLEIIGSGTDGVYSRNGNITITSPSLFVLVDENAAYAKVGNISIDTSGTFDGGDYGIRADAGNITLAGTVTAKAGHCAVYAPNGWIDSSAKLTATSSGSSESTVNYALKAGGLIVIRSQDGSYLKATGAYGGVWSVNGNITIYSDTEVSADYDAAYRADKGNVVFFYGTHTAKGGVKGYGPYCMNSGVYGQIVTVASTATMNASGSFVGIDGVQQVNIYGSTTAAATRASNVSYGTTAGVYSKVINIKAPLTASGKNYALQASDSLTIDSAYAIITPSAGKLGTYSSYKTVLNTAGDPATSVMIVESTPAVATVRVTYDGNGGTFTVRGQIQKTFVVNTTVGERYDVFMTMKPTREGYSFIGWYTAASGGASANTAGPCTNTSDHTLYAHWAKNPDTPSTPAPAGSATVKIAADGKSAQVSGDFTGLYARVALVIQNGSSTGLYVTQATINPDGAIVVPSFMVPGLSVKGISVALVSTLADISSSTPKTIDSDFMMF